MYFSVSGATAAAPMEVIVETPPKEDQVVSSATTGPPLAVVEPSVPVASISRGLSDATTIPATEEALWAFAVSYLELPHHHQNIDTKFNI